MDRKTWKRACLGIGFCGLATLIGGVSTELICEKIDNTNNKTIQEDMDRLNKRMGIIIPLMDIGGFVGLIGIGYYNYFRRDEYNLSKPYEASQEAERWMKEEKK